MPAERVLGDGARLGSLAGLEKFLTWGRVARVDFVGGRAGERFASAARRVHARGGGGNDRLEGTRGPDLLDGGPGRDQLDVYFGRDRCLRGEQLDRCEVRR